MFRSRLAWLYLLIVALVWLLGEVVGERTLPTLLLAYAPPVVWLLPAPLVLLWTLLRRRGVGVALMGLLLAAWGAGLLHWNAPPGAKVHAGGTLRVLTYNVLSGQNTTPEALAAHLNGVQADVILMQEARVSPAFAQALLDGMPGYTVRLASEVMTLTRLPVTSWESRGMPHMDREVLITTLKWQGDTLTVVNAHPGAVQVTDALAGDWSYLAQTSANRLDQVQMLVDLAGTLHGKVILGGDLNTPPRGVAYRRLRQAFGPDAHDQAGRGPGWTFPGLKLRIDHFMTRAMTPTRTQVMPAWGSDHRALLVDYRRP